MEAAAAARIAHIQAHLEKGFTADRIGNAVAHIENGTGSPRNCAVTLSNHACAKAMSSWFVDGDLSAMRQWFYVSTLLATRALEYGVDASSPGGRTLGLLLPLLSNDRPALDGYLRSITGCYHPGRIEDHKTHDFFAYQAVVGLHGDWGRLAERCGRVIADPPGSSGELKYSRDHKFYLALAHQDVPAMEQALGEIVTPHALKSRANDESGFTEGLISSWAVIYAKIAWLHGYEVKVDSLHIPLAWLPITPLPIYDVGYGFLRRDP